MSSRSTPSMRQAGRIHGGPLSRLKAGAQFQQKLEQLVRDALASQGEQYAALLPHCRSVVLRDDTLVLLMSSGSWAARLRFVQSEVLAAVNKELGANIEHFKAKVASAPDNAAPELGGRQRAKQKPGGPAISEAGAQTLMDAALGTSDAELAERLARLATRMKPDVQPD